MPQFTAWTAVIFVSLGGVLTGYYNSSINGILEMVAFQDNFPSIFSKMATNSTDQSCSSGSGDNSDLLVGFIVSIGNLGSMLGSIAAGRLSDIFSRRLVLAASGLILMLGSTILASSYYNFMWMLFLGRGISGITIGILYVLMPAYIGEMSPKEKRGQMMSIIGPGFAVGLLIGFCSNAGFARFEEGWRVTCAVLALGGLLYAVGFMWLPHTPRWLVMHNRDQEALLVLSKINYSSVKESFIDTYMDLEDLKEAKKTKNRNVLSQFLKWRYIRRLLLLMVFFFSAAEVVTLLAYYPVTFFCLIGISQPFTISIILGPINIIASILSAIFIDKMGRKMTLISTAGINFTLSLIAGILLQIFDSDNSVVNYIVAVFICAYSFFLFYAWTVVPWIIVAEVFPLNVKGIGSSISNSGYWLYAFFFNFITPRLLGPPLYLHGYLYITAAFNLFGAILVLLAIPETKGVSLEHIDEIFTQKWIKRIGCGFSCRNKSNRNAKHAVKTQVSDEVKES